MLSGAHLAFGDALARSTVWHLLFALLLMPSEIYDQIIGHNLSRTPDEDTRSKGVLWAMRIVVWGMIVFDSVATFWPPFATMHDPF
jgi:hypothetical protein